MTDFGYQLAKLLKNICMCQLIRPHATLYIIYLNWCESLAVVIPLCYVPSYVFCMFIVQDPRNQKDWWNKTNSYHSSFYFIAETFSRIIFFSNTFQNCFIPCYKQFCFFFLTQQICFHSNVIISALPTLPL